jgi:hypothetical protein
MTTKPRTHRIGNHAWSLRTGGQLTAAERTSMIPAVVAAHARGVAGRISMTVHLNAGRRRDLDPDRLTPPATLLTRVAEAHAVAHLDATLLNHSLRTYVFGAALGMVDQIEVDRELLYTAALLHDVALAQGAGLGRDFTIASAAVALQVADDVGLPSTAADALASAITLHHSPDVRPSDGPVAYLLSAGAALDVIGLRAWDLPPSTIAEVVAQHPRAGFKRGFARAFREEAARVPRGRAQFLQRYAAFGLAIRLAPFRG